MADEDHHSGHPRRDRRDSVRLLGALSDSPARFELVLSNLVNIRLRRDPYSSAYRFTADVLDAEEAM